MLLEARLDAFTCQENFTASLVSRGEWGCFPPRHQWWCPFCGFTKHLCYWRSRGQWGWTWNLLGILSRNICVFMRYASRSIILHRGTYKGQNVIVAVLTSGRTNICNKTSETEIGHHKGIKGEYKNSEQEIALYTYDVQSFQSWNHARTQSYSWYSAPHI